MLTIDSSKGFSLYETADLLWTMALKDRIAGTQDNKNVADAIRLFGKARTELQATLPVSLLTALGGLHRTDRGPLSCTEVIDNTHVRDSYFQLYPFMIFATLG